MSDSEITEFMNLTLDRERKQEKRNSEYVREFVQCFKKWNTRARNFAEKRKNEIVNCQSLDAKIKEVQSRIKTINTTQEDCMRQTKIETMKLLRNIVKDTSSLYSQYLSCDIREEGNNIYLFTFVHENRAIGIVKFKFDDSKNSFSVVDIRPDAEIPVVPENIIQKFIETQDTQGLLIYFRQMLLN